MALPRDDTSLLQFMIVLFPDHTLLLFFVYFKLIESEQENVLKYFSHIHNSIPRSFQFSHHNAQWEGRRVT